jgi:hypothetical protein
MNQRVHTWAQQAKVRGLAQPLEFALGVLAPLGIIGAQVIYVMQPAFSLFGLRDALTEIAQMLESPDELEALRAQLRDSDEIQP